MQQMLSLECSLIWLATPPAHSPVLLLVIMRREHSDFSKVPASSQTGLLSMRFVGRPAIKVVRASDISVELRCQETIALYGQWRLAHDPNFKDVLNELPGRDGLAWRNSPPAPLHGSAEGFNYYPPELLL